MNHIITVRITEELAEWLAETARKTGLPIGRIVRDQLEKARHEAGGQRFLTLAGRIRGGPPDLSSRKGFGRE